jgi:hypothetical protein
VAKRDQGSAKLRSKKQEAFARAVAVDGLGISAAYRASRDCSRMKATAINANAKREMKATPVRLRIEWLKAHGLAEQEGPGRPTAYRDEFCSQATHLCKLGAKDKDLAEFFDVDESTINRWKVDHPEFCESIKEGKIVTDMAVAVSLNKRATGYDFEEEVPIKLKEVTYADGKKVSEIEKIEMVKVRRIQPPDTGAAIFWLTNRQKDKWKQRVNNVVTGEDGGAVKVEDVTPQRPEDGRLAEVLSRYEAGAPRVNGHANGAAKQ